MLRGHVLCSPSLFFEAPSNISSYSTSVLWNTFWYLSSINCFLFSKKKFSKGKELSEQLLSLNILISITIDGNLSCKLHSYCKPMNKLVQIWVMLELTTWNRTATIPTPFVGQTKVNSFPLNQLGNPSYYGCGTRTHWSKPFDPLKTNGNPIPD